LEKTVLLRRGDENSSALNKVLQVRKYPFTPKRAFKLTWYRKPLPACLAALHKTKKEVEGRRSKKEINRKKARKNEKE
jgi:hypothetical protein